MRRLVVSTFVTLDGVMQAPGGPEEDDGGGFPFGGWTVPYFDESVGAFMDELMGKPFDLVLGRKTYDIFAGYWPHAGEQEGAGPLNAATKHVASRGRPELKWGPAALLEADVVDAVRALKQQDGPELQVHGSSELLQTLVPGGVVDELRVLTFPVVVGRGKRLFGGGRAATALRLVSSTTSSTGVVMSVYEPAGDVQTGTFAAE
ncbi:MAG TPA: dihydrofolate reductase family protein [Mycobacteriales bacterium]|nr:dihydrofolate reductase family protein [Mycobacteriales bacterium]